MDPTRSAYFLFRRHLLFISAPRTRQQPLSAQAPSNQQLGIAGTTMPMADQGSPLSKRQQAHESVQHAMLHITCVHRIESEASNNCSPKANEKPGSIPSPATPPTGEGMKSPTEMALELGLHRLLRSHERFPVPQLTLIELIRAVILHMQYHTESRTQPAVSGEYILRALCLFFCSERLEVLGRYAVPLMQVGCLVIRGARSAGSGGGISVKEFEQASFTVVRPTSLWTMPVRESLARAVFILCSRAVQDGATELIYASHNRWIFGSPPDPNPDGTMPSDIDSPFSLFPDQLRRGLVGPLMQYVQGFCMNECRMTESLADTCAIIRIDGVKFAVAQLTPSSMPELLLNRESNRMDKMDCPVNLIVGFPERTPDNVIAVGMKKILDAVELSEGPRSQLPHRHIDPAAFRAACRRIGARVFALSSQIFFRPEASDSVYIDPAARPLNKSSNLLFLIDNGAEGRTMKAKRAVTSFPNVVPFALCSRPSTHVLSRKSCSMALQLLMSLRDACAPVGRCAACVILYHGNVVLSDCHPYVTSLLAMRAQLSFYDSSRPVNCLQEKDDKSSKALDDIMDVWTGAPCRFQMPTGLFADPVFGEEPPLNEASLDNSGGGGVPDGAGLYERDRAASSLQGYNSNSLEAEDPNAIYLQPHLLPITAYFSPEVAALLPVPKKCEPLRKQQQQGAAKRHVGSFATSQGGCAIETEDSRLLSEGTYNGVHLASGGIDVIIIIASSNDQQLCDDDTDPQRICDHFRHELSLSARDMNALANHLSKNDAIQRKVDVPKDVAEAEREQHVDPSSAAAGQGRARDSSAAAQQQQDGAPPSFCLINDLALGLAHFTDGPLGSQDDVPPSQRISPSSSTLNRANSFLSECNVLANLLGGSLRLPKRYPDDLSSINCPFATEACTRVLLGRNAFAVSDRKGPHNILFSRQSGGQQVFFGTQQATLRTVEDAFMAHAAANSKSISPVI
jgi:hypothetical protein